jgi:polyisoprenoid-binding protein YceI
MCFNRRLFERALTECMDSNAQSLIVTILVGSLAVGTLSAETRTYELGPTEGSRFALEVYKTGLMSGKKHVFVFERYSGQVTFDEENPQDAKVRFVVDARSVVCTDTWVNEGSRKKIQAAARDQMLQADKYPELVFTSSKASAKGGGAYDVEGMLSIRGIERPVVVQVMAKPGEFEGHAVLNLSDWGLKPPVSGLSLGLIGTKKEMDVRFALKAKTVGHR